MKVRIGVGISGSQLTLPQMVRLVDDLEELGFDSLWLSEVLTTSVIDPLVGMSWAAGRKSKLKLGTTMLLPGRNPVRLAKELATLDVLSEGRLLPAFGLGVADGAEHRAFGVARDERASRFDEALPLMRRLWTEDAVDHDGRWFQCEGMSIHPKPKQQPLEVWLGGRAPSELRRVGRQGDGWLPSFTTPEVAAEGRVVVEEAAAAAGRAIDDEHWGALVVYAPGALPERLAALARARNPDTDPRSLFPTTPDEVADLLGRFVGVGFSKFVLVPAVEPEDWEPELRKLAETVLPLQR